MARKCPRCGSENPDSKKFCADCGTPLEPIKDFSLTKTVQTPLSNPGRTIAGKYKIMEEIGRGGMGVVYKAEDTKLKRTVALKFLTPELTKDKDAKRRFFQEAQAAAALNHPQICTVFEVDESDDQTFIAMEYIEGQSLKEKLESGSLKMDEAKDIITQVAEGLKEAHEKGIVHRDIKPANIMITRKGQAKITDFGLAKLSWGIDLTKTSTTMGTVAYMSPEQARGEKVDHRTDIWSLGVVLYEMLTGELPFKGEHEQAVIYSILKENPRSIREINPDISETVEGVINKSLQKTRKDRYQKCKEIIDDIQEAADHSRPTVTNNQKRSPKRTMTYAAIILFACLILLVSAWYIFLYNQNPRLDSIAILPFQNSSRDPNLAYLSREVPANIINNLSRLPSLRVIPRTTVFRFLDHETDPAAIGKELGVTTVLTGEVNVIGDRLIVRADLVDIEDNRQMWGQRFERKFSDLFDIEEEITREISEALPLQLTGEQKSSLIKRYTENIEAYRAYMEGRFWWNKRSPEGFAKAESMLNKAITIDPDYALAYAGLAECYCMVSLNLAKPEDILRRGRIAAEKALSLDNTLAEAHTSLAWIKFAYDWDWLGAERSFKEAIQLNPRYATAYNWYAVLLSFTDRHEEAIRYMTKAQELDPGSAIINRDLGIVYAWAGNYEKAKKQLQFTIDLYPDFTPAYFLMGVVHMYKKEYDSAIDYFKKVREMTGNFHDITGSMCYIYARSGQREAALNELQKLEELAEEQDTRASEFCMSYIGLGDFDKAFEWMDLSCKDHEFAILVMLGSETELWFEEMKGDPRLIDFRKRIGLEK